MHFQNSHLVKAWMGSSENLIMEAPHTTGIIRFIIILLKFWQCQFQSDISNDSCHIFTAKNMNTFNL